MSNISFLLFFKFYVKERVLFIVIRLFTADRILHCVKYLFKVPSCDERGKWIAAHSLHEGNTYWLMGHNTWVRPAHLPTHTQSSSILFAFFSTQTMWYYDSHSTTMLNSLHMLQSFYIAFLYYSIFSQFTHFQKIIILNYQL